MLLHYITSDNNPNFHPFHRKKRVKRGRKNHSILEGGTK